MQQYIFAIFDEKLGEFNTPVVFPSRGVAQRSLQDEVNRVDPQNAVNRYPSDFSLFCIGSFNTYDGVITSNVMPELVVRASDLVV